MAKILLTIISFLILAFIVVAMYCTLVIASRSDKNDNNKEDDEMFCKKQICPSCKTGKHTYDLDKLSESCPYIGCLKNGKCKFYRPL